MKRLDEVLSILEEDNWLTEQGIIYRGEWLEENECLEEGNRLKAIIMGALVAAGMLLGAGKASAKNMWNNPNIMQGMIAMAHTKDGTKMSHDGMTAIHEDGKVIITDDEGHYLIMNDDGSSYEDGTYSQKSYVGNSSGYIDSFKTGRTSGTANNYINSLDSAHKKVSRAQSDFRMQKLAQQGQEK